MSTSNDPQAAAALAARDPFFARYALSIRNAVVKSTVVLILWMIGCIAVGAGVTYYTTAQQFTCHSDHVLGFIPSGRTCVMEDKY